MFSILTLVGILVQSTSAVQEDYTQIFEPSADCEKLFKESDLRSKSEKISDLSKSLAGSRAAAKAIPFLGWILAARDYKTVSDIIFANNAKNYLDRCGSIFVANKVSLKRLYSEEVTLSKGAKQSAGAGFARTSYVEYSLGTSAEIGVGFEFLDAKLSAYSSVTIGESVSVEQTQQVEMNGDACADWTVVYFDRIRHGFISDPYFLKGEKLQFSHVLGPAVRAESACG